jgi:hypothetical protein
MWISSESEQALVVKIFFLFGTFYLDSNFVADHNSSSGLSGFIKTYSLNPKLINSIISFIPTPRLFYSSGDADVCILYVSASLLSIHPRS